MGITWLGNIAGLDRIGIPLVMAVRPNFCSVSVSQGKGLDLSQVTTASFHAEEVGEGRGASYRELAANCGEPIGSAPGTTTSVGQVMRSR